MTASARSGAGTAAEPEPVPERTRLHAHDLRLAYGERVVVDGLDLDVVDGTITAVIGPNGCGKSTLLRGLGRLMRPERGGVLLDGKQIHKTSTREVAKVLGLLPQSPSAPEGLTVADLVARGRHPHQSWYRQWSSTDESVVARSLELTGVGDLAERTMDELSGGQRQRVWLSMALAQGTDLLLLDEPTTYLDLSHQVDVLDLIGDLHRDSGRTVVMVLHDLNLAARYADRLVAMKDGAIFASGPPEEVLTPELLAEAFELTARVIEDPVVGSPMVVPVGGRRTADADRRTTGEE